jgi:phage baseplate assembly protein W
MATLKKLYSDIDFTFYRKPGNGDVDVSYDETAVSRSIRNLLSTRHYERPFNPNLGSNIEALLFELVSPITASTLEREIHDVITNYEPRAILKSVVATPDVDRNAYTVTVTFYLKNATVPSTVSLLLERNR